MKMHPGMIPWWRARQRLAECAVRAGCGPAAHHASPETRHAADDGYGDVGGGSFGVRRPLRFLARRLELDETQVARLAKVVADLKTERAQAEVDDRRTLAAFADAVGGPQFDAARAAEGAALRVAGAERLRDAVAKALADIHAVLDDKQRAELAYLIRTGTLQL
jgi:Spy/CpxP family protein refolding chaperone